MILFLFAGILFTASSQQLQPGKANQAGSPNWDIVTGIRALHNGQIIVTGAFYDSISFSTDTLISRGSRDVFIATCKADGSFKKAISFGGAGYEYVKKIEPLAEKGFLAPIQFNQTIEIEGQKFEGRCLNNILLAWFDNNMKLTSHALLGSNGKFDISSIKTSPDGDCYFSGWFTDTLVTENNKLISQNAEDMFLGKISNQGKLKWLKQFEGKGCDKSCSFISGTEGHNYMTGLTSMGCFGSKKAPNAIPSGMSHLFISEIDIEGEASDPCYPAYGYGIEPVEMLEDSSSLWILANFKYTAFLNKTEIVSHGKSDVLVIKFNPEDHSTSYCRFGGYGNEKASGLVKSGDYIVVTGLFTDSLSFANRTIVPEKRGSNVFIASLDLNCKPSNIISMPGEGQKFPCSVYADKSGIYLAGEFCGKIKSEANEMRSSGKEDIFLSRIENCSVDKSLNIAITPVNGSWELDAGPGFISYTWNGNASSSRYYTAWEPGTYEISVTDTLGCISTEEVNIFQTKSAVVEPDDEFGREFNLYPTITSGMVYWKAASVWEKSNASVRVFDPSGRLVVSDEIKEPGSNAHHIDFSGKPVGVYIVDISGNDFHETAKVIVKK